MPTLCRDALGEETETIGHSIGVKWLYEVKQKSYAEANHLESYLVDSVLYASASFIISLNHMHYRNVSSGGGGQYLHGPSYSAQILVGLVFLAARRCSWIFRGRRQ